MTAKEARLAGRALIRQKTLALAVGDLFGAKPRVVDETPRERTRARLLAIEHRSIDPTRVRKRLSSD